MPAAKDRWFEASSGRQVRLSEFHIQTFNHGFLEGRRELICKHVLDGVRENESRLLRATSAIYLDPQEVSPDSMPELVLFCNFRCFQSVQPGADYSSLTTVWLANDLHQSIPEFLTPRMRCVPWEEYASDYYW